MRLWQKAALAGLGGAAAIGVASALGGPGKKNLPPVGTVQHIVCLLQENHSFDNFFGTYPGANGKVGVTQLADLSDPSAGSFTGEVNVDTGMPDSPSHTYQAAALCYNGGRMDGFAASAGPKDAQAAVNWYDRDTIPDYWALADQFTLHDGFSQGYMGPSLPNHLYWMSGTNGYGVPGFNNPPVFGNDGNKVNGVKYKVPTLTWPTIFDQLSSVDASWHYYGDLDVWSPLLYFAEYRNKNRANLAAVQSTAEQFSADASSGVLDAVTYITPSFANSDHPGTGTNEDGLAGSYQYNDLRNGQAFVRQVIDSIVAGGFWESTVILLSWDEWGGYYDHVVPRFKDSQGPGFRVPLLVISPWSRPGAIIHGPAEFSSVPKLIEDFYGLPYLTKRIAGAGDLWEAFDWAQEPLDPPVWP